MGSRYAPLIYTDVLDEISGWVGDARLSVGCLDLIVICGDFNARVGQLLHSHVQDRV